MLKIVKFQAMYKIDTRTDYVLKIMFLKIHMLVKYVNYNATIFFDKQKKMFWTYLRSYTFPPVPKKNQLRA